MIIGVTATSLTFVALMVSIAAYFIYYRRQEESMLHIARMGFYTSVVLILFQGILLMWGILTHRFEWLYVFSYSSKDLPLYYLISTFWAGQEGTFLLWLIFGSIYGLVIIRTQRKDEPLVMSFMGLVQAFITMILIKKNPFTYVWEINPQAFQAGMTPIDGNGLNPLLQDPWMTIHPPVLFIGYSSSMILFALAMTALVKRNHERSITGALPFALFVAVSLGAGIILGGYWAYTTLGWGGYWGWDPVENSSLIPWLTSLALIHGLIIQKKQGGMKKTNIFMALLTFILVLYGSFLTRSGILTDFSVHSFGTSEVTQYLSGFVVFFLSVSILTFLFRITGVKSERLQTGFFTRESFMLFGLIALLAMAIFTFFGTSSPIITGLFGEASNVSIDYYNTMAAPIAILMALLIALSPVLRWKKESSEKFKTTAIHAIISLALGILFFILGMREILSLIIATLGVFIVSVNGALVYQMWKRKNYKFGGYLAHVGIGLMFIGIITSSVYDDSTKITLPKGMDKEVMGYRLSYEGKRPSPDGKDKVIVNINNTKTFAKFYWSDYSQAYMVAPSVLKNVTQDLYVSPIQIIPPNQNKGESKELVIKKGQKIQYGDYALHLKGYDMTTHAMNDGNIFLAAIIDVYNTDGQLMETIEPGLTMRGNKRELQSATLPNSNQTVQIKGVNVEASSLALSIFKPNKNTDPSAGKEMLAAEISVKPFINVLWLGTVVMVMGFLVAVVNRSKKMNE
ncbi:MAG: hypothetical protein GF313_16200 [Caldithrix sp.]|nr:hypothetical protein [Caldithrix sp.]